METIAEGNPRDVLALYAPTAVLVPTYSDRVLRGHKELLGYFNRFLGQRPGMTGTIDTITRQQPGYGLDIYSGTYTFYVPGEAPVPARYSFVVGPSRHGPTILNHHSSAMPS